MATSDTIIADQLVLQVVRTANVSVLVYEKLHSSMKFWKKSRICLSSRDIPLVVPGAYDKYGYSTLPTDNWYQFASETCFKTGRHVSGAIRAVIEWKTQSTLPPAAGEKVASLDRFIKPPTVMSASVSGGGNKSKMDFANESDFISLVRQDGEVLDPNDPMNKSILK